MRRITILVTLAVLLVSALFVLGQGSAPDTQPKLKIMVANHSCSLTLAENGAVTPEAALTPEATAESLVASATEAVSAPNYQVLTLGSDCYDVTSELFVPSNGTLWIGFSLPNEQTWQKFAAFPDDAYPPRFDKRGRFVGCTIPVQGEQTCHVVWNDNGTSYLIEIPVTVQKAFTTPVPLSTNVPVSAAATPSFVSTPSGVWGSCGSCGTCGGPVEQCVTAPNGTCAWDAATCEHPKHS